MYPSDRACRLLVATMPNQVRSLIVFLAYLHLVSAAIGAEFIPLGLLPSEPGTHLRSSSAVEISHDGLVVSGRATNEGSIGGVDQIRSETFRWTRETGFVPLGTSASQFLDMSADGSVVTWLRVDSAVDGYGDSIWSEEFGLLELDQGVGAISGDKTISDDGSITVGFNVLGSQGPYGPVKWTPEGGVESLDIPYEAFANDVRISPDGVVISGILRTGDDRSLGPVYRWTEEAGLEIIEEIPGRNFYSTTGISYDGSAIAGVSASVPEGAPWQTRWDAPKTLWRWTQATGMVVLAQGTTDFNFQDNLGQNRGSSEKLLSADGTVLAGDVRSNDDELAQVYRWTEERGLEMVPALPGHTRSSLKDMSPDGTWLYGLSCSLPCEDVAAWLWSEETGPLDLFDVFEAQGLGPSIAGWERVFSHDGRISADGHAIIGTGINPDGAREGWVAYLDPLVSEILTGDYNNNGIVEQSDLDLVLLHWGSDAVPDTWLADPPTAPIDQEELDKVLLGWGDTFVAMSEIAAIPEPTAAAIGVITLAGISVLLRRKR